MCLDDVLMSCNACHVMRPCAMQGKVDPSLSHLRTEQEKLRLIQLEKSSEEILQQRSLKVDKRRIVCPLVP